MSDIFASTVQRRRRLRGWRTARRSCGTSSARSRRSTSSRCTCRNATSSQPATGTSTRRSKSCRPSPTAIGTNCDTVATFARDCRNSAKTNRMSVAPDLLYRPSYATALWSGTVRLSVCLSVCPELGQRSRRKIAEVSTSTEIYTLSRIHVRRKHFDEPNPQQKFYTQKTIATRLAAANRSRVSIHGRPRKMLLTSSLITVQNMVAVSHTVCTLGVGAWMTQGRI